MVDKVKKVETKKVEKSEIKEGKEYIPSRTPSSDDYDK